MKTRLAGGILLIAGTAVGGGILALPVALAEAGFIYSVLLLVGCWAIMTSAALLLLEVTLWFPKNSHLTSMAGKTLGPWGVLLTWVSFLLLLYSLVAAYISGGTDLLRNLASMIHLSPNAALASILFTVLLGAVVWRGIRAVDLVNRGLMSLKLGAFFLLVLLLLWHIHIPWISQTGPLHSSSIMVVVTSFGFSVMIPSLRNYFHDDVRQLRLAILIGSAIPLLAYIFWLAAVMGVIPRHGEDGLIAMLNHGRAVSGMVNQISVLLEKPIITGIARVFTSVCLLTSFLGVSLCLVDFLADGFQVVKKGGINVTLCVVSLLPPLLIVLFRPDIFVLFLGWAGVLVIVLVVLLPVMMAWRGRYELSLARTKGGQYTVPGGKRWLLLLLAVSVVMTCQGVADLVLDLF